MALLLSSLLLGRRTAEAEANQDNIHLWFANEQHTRRRTGSNLECCLSVHSMHGTANTY